MLEIGELVELYAQAARNAFAAGFDGVEIHSVNGYLVNQFISEHANQRFDEYGGTLHNRLRFLREIVEAVADVVGPEWLGVRFTPLFEGTDQDRVYIGLVEADPHATYIEAIKVLEKAGAAYVSIAEADWDYAPDLPPSFREEGRRSFSGLIMYAGRYTAERAERLLDLGLADLVAFGSPFIANPDLPARIANEWPLNPLRSATLYGGGEEAFTDYPVHTAPLGIGSEPPLDRCPEHGLHPAFTRRPGPGSHGGAPFLREGDGSADERERPHEVWLRQGKRLGDQAADRQADQMDRSGASRSDDALQATHHRVERAVRWAAWRATVPRKIKRHDIVCVAQRLGLPSPVDEFQTHWMDQDNGRHRAGQFGPC